jgi:hypothetical protein
MKEKVGNIRHITMFEANHDGLHIKDDIQWCGCLGLSHKGSWGYIKTFKICVKSNK